MKKDPRGLLYPFRSSMDPRLSRQDWRVLGAVLQHDRVRDGQGCWAGRKRLAQESACSETHVSDSLSNLRRFRYIRSEPHPLNKRILVHRVIYEEPIGTNIGPADGTISRHDRSRFSAKQVPTGNANSLNGADKNLSKQAYKQVKINSVEEEANCAGARLPMKTEDLGGYLDDVSALPPSSLRAEYQALARIAEALMASARSLTELAEYMSAQSATATTRTLLP